MHFQLRVAELNVCKMPLYLKNFIFIFYFFLNY